MIIITTKSRVGQWKPIAISQKQKSQTLYHDTEKQETDPCAEVPKNFNDPSEHKFCGVMLTAGEDWLK